MKRKKNKKSRTQTKKKIIEKAFTLNRVRHHQLQIALLLRAPGFPIEFLEKVEFFFKEALESTQKVIKETNERLEKELAELEANKAEETNGEKAA